MERDMLGARTKKKPKLESQEETEELKPQGTWDPNIDLQN